MLDRSVSLPRIVPPACDLHVYAVRVCCVLIVTIFLSHFNDEKLKLTVSALIRARQFLFRQWRDIGNAANGVFEHQPEHLISTMVVTTAMHITDDGILGGITTAFTGPRRKSLFPKAARPAAPCATYCYPPHASVSHAISDLSALGAFTFLGKFVR